MLWFEKKLWIIWTFCFPLIPRLINLMSKFVYLVTCQTLSLSSERLHTLVYSLYCLNLYFLTHCLRTIYCWSTSSETTRVCVCVCVGFDNGWFKLCYRAVVIGVHFVPPRFSNRLIWIFTHLLEKQPLFSELCCRV